MGLHDVLLGSRLGLRLELWGSSGFVSRRISASSLFEERGGGGAGGQIQGLLEI